MSENDWTKHRDPWIPDQVHPKRTVDSGESATGVDPLAERRVWLDADRRASLEQLIPNLSAILRTAPQQQIEALPGLTLQQTAEALAVDHAFLWGSLPGEPELQLTHEWCDERSRSALGRADRLSGIEWPWLWDRLTRLTPVAVEDPADLPPEAESTRALLEDLAVKSFVAIPLASAGRMVGCLAFATERRSAWWSPDTIALLTFVGDALADALTRRDPRPEIDETDGGDTSPAVVEQPSLRRSASEDFVPAAPAVSEELPGSRELLRELGDMAAVNGEPPTARVLRLLDRSRRQLGLESGWVVSCDETAGEIIHVADPDPPGAQVGECFERPGELLRAALSATGPFWRRKPDGGLSTEALWPGGPYVGAAVVLPLRSEGQRSRFLLFFQQEPRPKPVEENELDWLRVVARWVETELQRDEQARRLQFHEFAREHNAVPQLWLDGRGRVSSANLATSGLLGYTPEELGELSLTELEPGLSEGELELRWKTLREVQQHRVETRMRTREGNMLAVELRAHALTLEDEPYLCVYIRDLRQRKQTEETLRDAESRFRTLFNDSPDALLLLDPRTAAPVEFNEVTLGIVGYSRDDLPRVALSDLGVGPFAQELRERIQAALQFQRAERFESRLRTARGEIRDVLIQLRPISLSGRTFVQTTIRDISARKAIERTLRDSEKRFARAFRSSPVAMLVAHLGDGRIVDANDALLKAVGYGRAEVIGRTAPDLGLWQDQEDYGRVLEQLQQRGSIAKQSFELVTRTGERRQAVVSADVLEMGGEPSLLAVVQDVTERRNAAEERDRLETLLRQSQKMESLGQLAGGVAHDFNNVLTAILGNNEIVLRRLAGSGDGRIPVGTRASLEQVQRAGERGAALVRQLLAFSRKQARKLELLDPNRVVADMQAMLQRLIGEHIRLELQLEPALSTVRGDTAQLEQLILNLVLNARDSMPQGGRLLLQSEMVDPPGQLATSGDASRFVCVRVRDTGCGMDEETLRHIFEPFFTTKPEGRGTGLGLATSDGIVKQAGGHIGVESAPGRGSTFSVFLPATPGEPQTAPPQEAEQPQVGDETILLCEDDELVRRLSREILESAGYTVLVAENGREALRCRSSHPHRVHLLITDTIMPEMNGVELAETLTRNDGSMRVLFITGYTEDMLEPYGIEEDRIELLRKPFSSSSLLKRIRRVLDA